jgi:outer membrane biosynthesis protein TonB
VSTLTLQHPGETSKRLQGWAGSLVIHGLAVLLSVALVSSLRLPPEPTVFTWDVAVVEAPPPRPAEQPAPTPARSKPKKASPPPVAPNPVRRQVEPVRQQSEPVTQQVRPVAQPVQPVAPEIRPVEPVQQIRPVEPVLRQDVRSVAPIAREHPAASEQALLQSAAVLNRPVQPVEATPQPLPVSVETETVVEARPVSPLSETQVIAPPPVLQREARRDTRPEVRREAPAMASVPTPVPPPKEQPPLTTAKAVVPPEAAIQELRVRPDSQKRRDDYGWLIEALRQSLRKVRPTLERGGKLRLMLRIRQDGGQVDLIDLAVAESSGYLAVDRKAIEVVRQAFPLEHTGKLDNPEVSINMPFRLDVLETR